MDIKNVTDQYIVQLEQLKTAAELAARRKGESVRDHPLPQQLIARHLWKRQMKMQQTDPYQLLTTVVPSPYPPCTRSVYDLQPILISEMKLETHHRGSKVLLRVLTYPDRINAAMAIVEDQEGTAVLIQLYHLPEESVVPAHRILYKDRVCILKEPFFKVTPDGTYSLRVDHVNDIVWLAPDDERILAKWRGRRLLLTPNGSLEARMEGNKAVKRNDWAEAARLYSSAINAAGTLEESRLAHLNRSLANLRLGHFESSLSDARKGIQNDKPTESEKAIFREAQALYGMHSYRECMEKLIFLTKEFPGNNAVKPALDRAQARLREQLKGAFSFRRMYKEAEAGTAIVDCATFTGPVEIRPSPGRGRGLFTTTAVAAGDLLVCEKAFAYCYAEDDELEGIRRTTILMDWESKKMIMGGQAHLISQIVQKLLHSPESSKKFLELHHGEYEAVSADDVDGRPVVDSFLVTKTILVNCFGAPRTSRARLRVVTPEPEGKKDLDGHKTSGIWIMASYLNHSCVGNCQRSFIGDVQIIRATQDIPADTELVFSYRGPEPLTSYAETQKNLQNWGFQCDCPLCLGKKATTEDTLKLRKALMAQLKSIMGRSVHPQSINIKRAMAVLEKVESTYATPVRKETNVINPGSAELSSAQITPRLEIWEPYFALGGLLLSTGKKAKAVKMTVKGLEALGFVITATLPADGSKKASTSNDAGQLVIKSWGMVVHDLLHAFLTLFRAYKATSPELAQRAREYVATTYSMLVGEKETVLDEIPELR